MNIGRYYSDDYRLYGYISNFRVNKGTAVYTGAFTKPTAPLTDITNTKLIACSTNNHKLDRSSGNKAINSQAGPVRTRPFSPFKNNAAYDPAVHGGSFLFEGNGNSYLSASHATLFDFGTTDHCIEVWVYPTENTYELASKWRLIADVEGANNYWGWTTHGGDYQGLTIHTNTLDSSSGATTEMPVPFAWNHIVYQFTGGVANWYINGTRVYEATRAHTWADATGIRVGNSGDYNDYFYGGYATDFRVTTGANYNPYSNAATLTVPTAPLTKGSYTRLLLNGTNAAMFDQAGKTNIETVGNAQLNTSIKKFGTASAKFDESGDILLVQNVPYFYKGDFTIEGFVYFNSSPTDGQGLFVYDSLSLGNRAAVGPALGTYANSPYQGKWHSYHGTQASGGTGTQGNSEATPSATTWIHFAYVRTSGVIKIFIDGTQIGSDIAWTNRYQANPLLTIAGYYSDSYLLNGYLDSYRATLKARYTSNFTAPTEAFPNI